MGSRHATDGQDDEVAELKTGSRGGARLEEGKCRKRYWVGMRMRCDAMR